MIVDSEAPINTPLTAGAAAFLTQLQMKLVLPSLNMTNDLEVTNPVICAECQETFKTLEEGSEHMDREHVQENRVPDIQALALPSKEESAKHKTNSSVEDVNESGVRINCEICSYTSCYFLDMLVHKTEMHKEYHINPIYKENPALPHIFHICWRKVTKLYEKNCLTYTVW